MGEEEEERRMRKGRKRIEWRRRGRWAERRREMEKDVWEERRNCGDAGEKEKGKG